MSAPRNHAVGVLWCGNARSGRSNGWAFPPRVSLHLRALTKGKRVCHLFGGRANFGLRCDIDPVVRPDVFADAWLPPFVKNAFDVVILDPPYLNINQQMKQQLLRAAGYIAADSVIWFHTMWVASDRGLTLRESWLVRVGDSCSVRCLQVFAVNGEKTKPRNHFTRGPAMKYNRWLMGQTGLPFGVPAAEVDAPISAPAVLGSPNAPVDA